MISTPRTAVRESEILRKIVLAAPIILPGSKLWRINSTGKLPGGRYSSRSAVGVSDLVGLTRDGRFLSIECKTETGKQSEEQIHFQHEVERRGGIYILARSVDDLFPHATGRS